MRLIRGMTENFNEPCDLIVSNLRAPLNPRVRKTPMLLVGRASREAAARVWSGAAKEDMRELLVWGSKKEMRVWVVNAPAFPLPADLQNTATPEDMSEDVPVALAEALLVEYPGAKDVVADPSMGTGTVGAAARNLGLYFVGYEAYVERFTAAQARLAA